MQRKLRGFVAVAVVAASLSLMSIAQDALQGPPPEGGQGHGMRAFNGVGGQITAIEGSTITLHTFRGDTAKVKITSSTRFMKDRAEAKLTDFKIGDRVFVGGQQGKDGVWTAEMMGQRTGQGGPMGGMQMNPADNGKAYILGELVKVEGTRLTIRKPDNTEQVIAVDDDTSFRNQRRESITLADIKVGDFVRGMGAVKYGIFVPKELNAGRPRGPRPDAPPPAPDGSAAPGTPSGSGAPSAPSTQPAPESTTDNK